MSQEDIVNILKKHNRLVTRQIAELLNDKNICKISATIHKMLEKDIKAILPTKEEKENLYHKYPSLKKANKKELRLFVLIRNV